MKVGGGVPETKLFSFTSIPLYSPFSTQLFVTGDSILHGTMALWFFASGDQSIGASASASVLPMIIQDWFPLGFDLAVQGTLKSLLQHHSLKASILWCSAFFMVQLSHPDKTTGRTIALIIWTFVGKVLSLLLNMLFRFVIAFFPSFNFMAAVTICSDFGAQENKACHCFHCFSIYLALSDGTRCNDLRFLNIEF